MKSKGAIKVILFLFLSSLALPAQSFDNSYALVIGIDHYKQHHWKALSYAAKDAAAMGGFLSSQGYQVTYLYNDNATKEHILEEMQNVIAPQLKPNDRILIFFAGHGYTEELGG